MTETGPRGAERGHPFFRRCISAKKKEAPKTNNQREKKMVCQIFHKKNQKVLMKIQEMVEVYLN